MKNRIIKGLIALLLLLSLLLPQAAVLAGRYETGNGTAVMEIAKSKKKKKNTATPTPTVKATPAPKATDEPKPEGPTATPVPQGPITDVQSIADYLFANGCLPDNFMTKKEAQALGWPGGDLSRYAPGMSIGGDHFGNYEGILPKYDEKGKKITYHECDVNYTRGSRGADRVVFSSNGHVYYTADHYNTFTEIFPSVPGSQVYFEFMAD